MLMCQESFSDVRGAWIEHSINYLEFEEKKDILQMPLPAKTFTDILSLEKALSVKTDE